MIITVFNKLGINIQLCQEINKNLVNLKPD